MCCNPPSNAGQLTFALSATSQLFTSSFKVEGDFMPASSDGLIADIHVSSFQTSIDDLLQAAR